MVSAFAWGLAEATLFFLVPDIILTWIVFRRPRYIVSCYCMTLLGALLGGGIMYCWGSYDLKQARFVLDHIPAIAPSLFDEVYSGLRFNGVREMFIGSLSGIPYKLYAIHAPAAGIDIRSFLLFSIPARMLRWVVAGLAVYLVNIFWLKYRSEKTGNGLFLIFWMILYITYFSIMEY